MTPEMAARQEGDRRVWLAVAPAQWGLILGAALLVPAATVGGYAGDSPWIGVGIALTVIVTLHTAIASRVMPWFPGLAALVACLQWVLAPWAAYHLPPLVPAFTMVVPPAQYFSYAVPCVIALTVGLYLPLWRGTRAARPRAPVTVPHGFGLTCDVMVALGLLARLVLTQDIPWSITYGLALVSDLAWVGAFGLLLVRAGGWGWRIVLVALVRAALTSSDAMFHDFLLWAAASILLIAFVYRLRPAALAAIAIVGTVGLGAINEVKGDYRATLIANSDLSLSDRASVLGRTLGNQLAHPAAPFTDEALVRTVTRANQGWIIARVMTWVPAREPFAEGETVGAAIVSALWPRVADPDKYVAGGATYFQRFTGLPLPRATSMNLSVAGEMFANFGPLGGVCGVFAIGLLIGWIVARIAARARTSVLWWAWAPYVLLYAMQAENGLGEELNQIVKAVLVAAVIVVTTPAWRTVRRSTVRAVHLRPVAP